MTDSYSDYGDAAWTPARRAVPVTPHDTDVLAETPKALFVGSGGTIVMRGAADSADRSWLNVPDGALIPFRPALVKATGTTATDMLALY